MYKIGFQTIDFYDSEEMLTSMISGDVPDFVKSAKLLSYEDRIEMGDDHYAVVIMTKTGHKVRRFPVFDKAHTWLSCNSFKKTAHKLPLEAVKIAASNLYSNCIYHDIECPELIKKFASEIYSNTIHIDEDKDLPLEHHLKLAIANKKAKEVKDEEYGIKEAKLYPLNTKGNVQTAINYFKKTAHKLLPKYKNEFARQICKYASLYEIQVPNAIDIYGRNEQGNRVQFNLSTRKVLVKTAKERDFLDRLVGECKSMDKDRLISLVEKFDKLAGLDKYWDRQIKNPYESVLEKAAMHAKDMGIRNDDIEAYAKTNASIDLPGQLPEETINEFIMDPIKKYKSMPEIQQQLILRGVTGAL